MREVNFFLMQEHIQQVSLSELMTSWSHILPAPLPLIWREQEVMGGRGGWGVVCVCVYERVSEYVLMVEGVFYSGDGLKEGEGGAVEEVIWELSRAPLNLSPRGLWSLGCPSTHENLSLG